MSNELQEATDDHVNSAETNGIDSEQQLVMRIRRLEREYSELLDAATDKTNEASAIFQQLETERAWTRKLSEEATGWIRRVDALEAALHGVVAERDQIFNRILHVMGAVQPQHAAIDLNLNKATNVWEKPS